MASKTKNVQLVNPKKPLRAELDVPEEYEMKDLVLHGDQIVTVEELPDGGYPERVNQLIAAKRIKEVNEDAQPNLLGPNGETGQEPLPQPLHRDPSTPQGKRFARVVQENMRANGRRPGREVTRDIGMLTSARMGTTAYPPGVPCVYVSRDGRYASQFPFDEAEADGEETRELEADGEDTSNPTAVTTGINKPTGATKRAHETSGSPQTNTTINSGETLK